MKAGFLSDAAGFESLEALSDAEIGKSATEPGVGYRCSTEEPGPHCPDFWPRSHSLAQEIQNSLKS